MKISLFLMTNKGCEVLNALIKNNLVDFVDKIIVGIDNDVINDYSNEIIEICKLNQIPFFLSNQIFQINSSYALAISWRWIINIENLKLIILHDSLLPKYRGFAPLVNSLINKEQTIGVTALFASDEYDKGAVILQRQSSIIYPIKIDEAIAKVSILYSEIVVDIFKKLSLNIQIESFYQNEVDATYSLWRDSEDYFINWNNSSSKIKRFIDAVGFPYQGAKCFINDEIVLIQSASVIDDLIIENRDVGKVIFIQQNKPVIVCGKGLLKIEEAIFKNSKNSILPLKNFRTRFK
ncbi:formyltransferase family protein [Flavobacterium sp. 120]|uniref:formyltransferase family protein n=1 Tax=Flavobacterium sp. 120 TaxID=2135626 RepID=UPI000EAF0C58|nr:formyltransferase family protein [Flavobacterium sp. 120]RKS13374.1 methionyl-tRNA formyltransferase [Flavobacterium sp. 120]